MLAPLFATLTAIFVALLLIAEYRGRSERALLAKSCASLSFVMLGALAARALDGAFERCLLSGLIAAAIGDVLLALPGPRAFQVGIGAFGLGHVAYLLAARSALGDGELPNWLWLAYVPSLAAYARLYKYLGTMRVPVAAYIVVITLMVVYAIALYLARPNAPLPFVLGALLFYLSDLSVAQDRFVRSGFIHKLWGLPTYYAAQILIAWSVAQPVGP